MLMGDVRHERLRVAVRPQASARLVPDEITLRHEAGPVGPGGEVAGREQVPPVLVRVAHDHRGIGSRFQDAPQLGEDELHPVEVGRVVGAVGQIGRVGGDHRVVGPPIGVRLGQRPARHRERQLDVVRRVGGDEVDRPGLERWQDRKRIADPELDARRVERARTARVRRSEVREQGALAVALGEQVADDRSEDGGPARFDLDPDRAPGAAGDRSAEQRPADAGERIEHEIAGLREELDQPGHQARGLVRPVGPPDLVPQLGRVGGRPDRLREVQPLLAGKFVQRVARVRWSSLAVHRAPAYQPAAHRCFAGPGAPGAGARRAGEGRGPASAEPPGGEVGPRRAGARRPASRCSPSP